MCGGAAAILHALPSLLKAGGAAQLMLPSPRASLCVFESSAALLVAAITLLGARKARELSHVLPLLLLKA